MPPRPSFSVPVPYVESEVDWLPDYPNPPDLRFDYYRLLDLARTGTPGIGIAPSSRPSVAIVGAGCAGLVAARELFRCGYRVTIFEGSGRIGGRHYTVPVRGQTTAMELGATRFPFFDKIGSKNCVLDYYLNTEANATMQDFPNPGSAPGGTGIYVNQGYGPSGQFFPNRRLISWPAGGPPDNPALNDIFVKVRRFTDFFSRTVADRYHDADWLTTWEKIADNYEKMSFSDLVFTETVTDYGDDGWLGGFGLNDEEAALFYTIGAGDGSWGAFYEIGAMWFIRCVMFGFNSNLQSVFGILDKNGLPFFNATVRDNDGVIFPSPLYEGIEALDNWLLFKSPPGAVRSLFDASRPNDGSVNFFVKRAVRAIRKTGATLEITDSFGVVMRFDYAVVTPQIWASQLSVELSGFDIANDLPLEVLQARDEQHQIASCKVFYPLTQTYWLHSNIPQILVTDTFVQDAYGVKWAANDAGALLASYTWEDDAAKLLTYNDAPNDLGRLVLDELDRITQQTVGDRISRFVDANAATVIHWLMQPTYHGCAKLYRQRNWAQNYALLTYNQEHSASSRLYFAGESYGVEGGWTEPALRLALDAVIRLIANSEGTFNNGFTLNDYPRYDTAFQPDQDYPVCND